MKTLLQTRSPYWDTLKGLLILLVILGHCGTALSEGLLSVIYSFHMPLFVFISGYFSKKQPVISKQNKRLAIIYLFFNTIYILLDVTTEDFSLNRLLVPSFALWYILSLIYWRCALQLIPDKWIERPVYLIIGSIVFGLIAGFIPVGNEMSFQRTFSFWPFFIAGFYLRKYDGIKMVRVKNKWFFGITLIILLLVVYHWVPPFYGNNSYNTIDDIWMRGLQILLASVICFCILVIIPEKMGKITIIGQYTLILYLLHPPLVKIMKVISTKIGYTPDLIIALIITVITSILIFSVRKFKIFKYLT